MANEISVNIQVTSTVGGTTTQLSKVVSLNNATGDQYAATIATSSSKVQLAPGAITIANCQGIAVLNLSSTAGQIINFSSDSGGVDIVATALPGGPPIFFVPNQAGAYPYYFALAGTPSMQVVVLGS